MSSAALAFSIIATIMMIAGNLLLLNKENNANTTISSGRKGDRSLIYLQIIYTMYVFSPIADSFLDNLKFTHLYYLSNSSLIQCLGEGNCSHFHLGFETAVLNLALIYLIGDILSSSSISSSKSGKIVFHIIVGLQSWIQIPILVLSVSVFADFSSLTSNADKVAASFSFIFAAAVIPTLLILIQKRINQQCRYGLQIFKCLCDISVAVLLVIGRIAASSSLNYVILFPLLLKAVFQTFIQKQSMTAFKYFLPFILCQLVSLSMVLAFAIALNQNSGLLTDNKSWIYFSFVILVSELIYLFIFSSINLCCRNHQVQQKQNQLSAANFSLRK